VGDWVVGETGWCDHFSYVRLCKYMFILLLGVNTADKVMQHAVWLSILLS